MSVHVVVISAQVRLEAACPMSPISPLQSELGVHDIWVTCHLISFFVPPQLNIGSGGSKDLCDACQAQRTLVLTHSPQFHLDLLCSPPTRHPTSAMALLSWLIVLKPLWCGQALLS